MENEKPCSRVRPRSPSDEDNESRDPKIPRLTPKRDPALLYYRQSALCEEPLCIDAVKKIMVLGDSYSANTRDSWVGFLVERIPSASRPSVDNFARPGATAEHDLDTQVKRLFGKTPSASSVDGESLIVAWFGINDCGTTDDADDLEQIVERIFDALHDLYVKWKGKNFLLIDVPPMHRSPGGVDVGMDDERYIAWNEAFLSQAKEFAETAANASTYVVSAYRIIGDILDNPEAHGLLQDTIESLSEYDSDASEEEEKSEDEGDDESNPGSSAGRKEKDGKVAM
ncbi:hypothetical protein CC1G_10674 [Coprinopsis cinerea okayama7|uniref:Uncharacterized protein n=1 Tax=Coprinopsis cinerea (strain Okayama-7 / 130 / ATCC MYA-4618 / FGSC 9003) TaxID=240176 RepID=A8NDP8_COPC7|nr:hypothetical protein CC1G_10674 [Coprinopsis cinerea okayama7\|eukprot:XP_001832825.2 hypothetical protein CC1G_10674 [Coprinopsis cinerea okayama7\